MSKKSFNPSHHSGKDVVYASISNIQGICSVWDWSKTKSKYVKRESGNRFYAYKRVNGIQRSKCFDNFEQAKQWRDSAELFVEDVGRADMKFSEAMFLYFNHMKGKLRVSTIETYESNAKHLRFFNDMPVSQINPKVIDQWLVAIKMPEYLKLQHVNRVSYRHEISVLRRVLTYYAEYISDSYQVPLRSRHLDDGIIDHQKYQQAKDRNRNHFIPRADFELFLEGIHRRAAEKINDRMVLAALAEFQLGTGTRIGEACAIDWTDVDLTSGAVFVGKTVQWARKRGRSTCISPLTKTSESRTVFMSERALHYVRQWREKSGRSKGLVFSHDGFAPLSYRAVQHHYDAVFESLGMKWRSTHIIRHSYATDFLERTGNKSALQGQLGHITSKQTDHYAKVTASAVQAGVRAYNESLRGSNVVELHPKTTNENPEVLGDAGRTGGNMSAEKQNPSNSL